MYNLAKNVTHMVKSLLWGAFLMMVPFAAAGCATYDEKTMMLINQQQTETIESLNDEIYRLNTEMEEVIAARQELVRAKGALEERLKTEMADGTLSLAMEQRGLVITLLDQILFDSGKSELKSSSLKTLNILGTILEEKVGENMVYVEGHTDNVPIRHSGWRSNWELSTARATEVIQYFVSQRAVNPHRIAAAGYGEFQPVSGNDSEEGRRQNRRVEIVISPKKMFVTAQAI